MLVGKGEDISLRLMMLKRKLDFADGFPTLFKRGEKKASERERHSNGQVICSDNEELEQ